MTWRRTSVDVISLDGTDTMPVEQQRWSPDQLPIAGGNNAWILAGIPLVAQQSHTVTWGLVENMLPRPYDRAARTNGLSGKDVENVIAPSPGHVASNMSGTTSRADDWLGDAPPAYETMRNVLNGRKLIFKEFLYWVRSTPAGIRRSTHGDAVFKDDNSKACIGFCSILVVVEKGTMVIPPRRKDRREKHHELDRLT